MTLKGIDVGYIAIDGDDIGRRITAMYLRNDAAALGAFVGMLQDRVQQVGDLLKSAGGQIIFCAADGVVAQIDMTDHSCASIYNSIEDIGAGDITFSAGVGDTLRNAYIALLAAKSNGKARLCAFQDLA